MNNRYYNECPSDYKNDVTQYVLVAKGIGGATLATKKFASKPTFKQTNSFANRIATKYGAHPSVELIKV